MNDNKKRKASGRVPVAALLAPKRSIVLLDPKGESFAMMANRAQKNRRGVLTLNPFVVLPPDQLAASKKWFRLSLSTAINDLIKGQRKESNDRQQRKSQRTH